jgi:GNAT superfamily N-acetyltransferase
LGAKKSTLAPEPPKGDGPKGMSGTLSESSPDVSPDGTGPSSEMKTSLDVLGGGGEENLGQRNRVAAGMPVGSDLTLLNAAMKDASAWPRPPYWPQRGPTGRRFYETPEGEEKAEPAGEGPTSLEGGDPEELRRASAAEDAGVLPDGPKDKIKTENEDSGEESVDIGLLIDSWLKEESDRRKAPKWPSAEDIKREIDSFYSAARYGSVSGPKGSIEFANIEGRASWFHNRRNVDINIHLSYRGNRYDDGSRRLSLDVFPHWPHDEFSRYERILKSSETNFPDLKPGSIGRLLISFAYVEGKPAIIIEQIQTTEGFQKLAAMHPEVALRYDLYWILAAMAYTAAITKRLGIGELYMMTGASVNKRKSYPYKITSENRMYRRPGKRLEPAREYGVFFNGDIEKFMMHEYPMDRARDLDVFREHSPHFSDLKVVGIGKEGARVYLDVTPIFTGPVSPETMRVVFHYGDPAKKDRWQEEMASWNPERRVFRVRIPKNFVAGTFSISHDHSYGSEIWSNDPGQDITSEYLEKLAARMPAEENKPLQKDYSDTLKILNHAYPLYQRARKNMNGSEMINIITDAYSEMKKFVDFDDNRWIDASRSADKRILCQKIKDSIPIIEALLSIGPKDKSEVYGKRYRFLINAFVGIELISLISVPVSIISAMIIMSFKPVVLSFAFSIIIYLLPVFLVASRDIVFSTGQWSRLSYNEKIDTIKAELISDGIKCGNREFLEALLYIDILCKGEESMFDSPAVVSISENAFSRKGILKQEMLHELRHAWQYYNESKVMPSLLSDCSKWLVDMRNEIDGCSVTFYRANSVDAFITSLEIGWYTANTIIYRIFTWPFLKIKKARRSIPASGNKSTNFKPSSIEEQEDAPKTAASAAPGATAEASMGSTIGEASENKTGPSPGTSAGGSGEENLGQRNRVAAGMSGFSDLTLLNAAIEDASAWPRPFDPPGKWRFYETPKDEEPAEPAGEGDVSIETFDGLLARGFDRDGMISTLAEIDMSAFAYDEAFRPRMKKVLVADIGERAKRDMVFIAIKGNEPIGTVISQRLGGSCAHMFYLFVQSEDQLNGVGTKLMDCVLGWAKENSITVITLTAALKEKSGIKPSFPFYRKYCERNNLRISDEKIEAPGGDGRVFIRFAINIDNPSAMDKDTAGVREGNVSDELAGVLGMARDAQKNETDTIFEDATAADYKGAIESPGEFLIHVREYRKAEDGQFILNKLLSEDGYIPAEEEAPFCKTLADVGVFVRGSDDGNYRFADIMNSTSAGAAKSPDIEYTRNMINIATDVMAEFEGKTSDFVHEMIRTRMVDQIYRKTNESAVMQDAYAMRIWKGYGANSQISLMQKVAGKTKGRIQFEDDLDKMVEFALNPENINDATVTILPRNKLKSKQQERLDRSAAGRSGARIIYIDYGLKADELADLEGLIAVGTTYLNNAQDSFYRLYRLLARGPVAGVIPLARLKAEPCLFIDTLKFTLRSIKPANIDELPHINRLLEKLLLFA